MTSEPSVARRRGDVRRVPSEPIARRVAGRSGTNGAVPDETEDHDATTPAIEDGRRGRRARTVDGEKRDAVVPLVMPEGRRRGLSVPKASDVLADSLRQRILSGELPTGSALPVERELAATTRLSRTAVREALRILEIEGLIEIRPGRSGGSFVRRPSVHAIGRTVDTFITGRGITLRALLEVREALEPAGAELAARNRTDTDMDLLDDATARLEQALDDPARFLVANIEWHEAVVRASGNELLYAFMRSLSRVVHRATSDAHFDSDETRRLTARAHRKILGAIRDQDAMAARAAMERHVHAYRVEIESVAVPDELMVEADDDRARREEI